MSPLSDFQAGSVAAWVPARLEITAAPAALDLLQEGMWPAAASPLRLRDVFCCGRRMAGIDRSGVEREWLSRGFSCGLWVDPPGQVWEGYVHATDELLMVLEGQLELAMEGKTFRPAVGETVFIPAGTVHSVRNVGGMTSRWLYGYKEAR